MSKTTIEKMIIEETKELSEEKLNKVLDFILSLKAKRHSIKKIISELKNLNKLSLNHLEEEFSNYKELTYHYELGQIIHGQEN